MINYFNFKKKDDEYLITNDAGRYLFISQNTFEALTQNKEIDKVR